MDFCDDFLLVGDVFDHVPTDDWTVPKLIAIGVLVLGTFFAFIINVSPFDGLGRPASPAIRVK